MLTININDIGIVFYENPISRAYLKLFYDESLNIKNFFYLKDKSFLPNKISSFMFFKKNNFYALNFLKDKNIKNLISQFEEYFGMPNSFCKEMYYFSNLDIINKINYIQNKSINSFETLKVFSEKKLNNSFVLNTGNEIIKDALNLNINFIHIHPGFLPDVRGADGTLNSILFNNCLGVTSFIITKKIDQGPIFLREKFEAPKFKLKNYHNYDLKNIYRIWYSFFDPLLRVSHLKKLFNLKNIESKTNNLENVGNYYSFLNNYNLKIVFDKIFN